VGSKRATFNPTDLKAVQSELNMSKSNGSAKVRLSHHLIGSAERVHLYCLREDGIKRVIQHGPEE
jgi:hypothetical protein